MDSFQGREKDVVIFDVVHTGKHKVLESYRRLNVAITRARKKLIVIAPDTLGYTLGLPFYSDLYRYFMKEGIVVGIATINVDDEMKAADSVLKIYVGDKPHFRASCAMGPLKPEEKEILRRRRIV